MRTGIYLSYVGLGANLLHLSYCHQIAKKNGPVTIITLCKNLKEALERSYKKSLSSGKLYPILFSPASASFDNYKSFEERGDCFKKLFKKIRKKVA